MRVLLDTNVLVAAFVARGYCHELLEHCVRSHRVVSSRHILEELHRALSGKLGYQEAMLEEALELIEEVAILVAPDPLPRRISADPDDDPILAAAAAGDCACLVTGDQDLLVLEEIRGIPILEPSEFWPFEAERRGEGEG